MGKTSLLARGSSVHLGAGTSPAVSTDLQKFNAADFKTVNSLYLTIAESIADQLKDLADPADSWGSTARPQRQF